MCMTVGKTTSPLALIEDLQFLYLRTCNVQHLSLSSILPFSISSPTMDDSASKNQPPPYRGSAQDGHAGQTPRPSNNEWNHSLFDCFSPGDTCTYPVLCSLLAQDIS